MTHTCSPSYSEGRERRITNLRPAWLSYGDSVSERGWMLGCRSVVEHLLSICEAQISIPSTAEEERRQEIGPSEDLTGEKNVIFPGWIRRTHTGRSCICCDGKKSDQTWALWLGSTWCVLRTKKRIEYIERVHMQKSV